MNARRLKFVRPVLALLLAVSLSVPAAAEELVVGFEDLDFYPYGKPSEEEIFVGYLRAILEAFAEDRGHRLTFAVTPLKRLYLGFKEGDVDMFIPDNPAWSHEYKQGIDVYYSGVVAVALDGFAVAPGRERETVGHDVVHVGAILGFTVEPLFDDAQRKLLAFDRASRFESLFKSLLLGRVDAVYCNLAAANNVLAAIGETPDSVAWSQTLPRFKSLFHVSSTRRELIEELDDWLGKNAAEVTALKRQYGILDLESLPWGE
jgi:polar amino acid transport system substrate-binding protein